MKPATMVVRFGNMNSIAFTPLVLKVGCERALSPQDLNAYRRECARLTPDLKPGGPVFPKKLKSARPVPPGTKRRRSECSL